MTDAALSTPSASHPAAPCPSDKDVLLDGRHTAIRLYGDPQRKEAKAFVLHFHGGTFTNGTLDDGRSVGEMLASAGALVASVAYPLAPDHPFPAAIDTGYAALAWLKAQRGRRQTAHVPIFVAGEEAGGNLAAAVAMMARDRDPGLVAGQLLFAPVLDPCMASASSRDASIGVGGCALACGWRDYLSQPCDISHPYAAPAVAVRLTNLPPALLVSFRGSPLLGDARQFATRLSGAGVVALQVESPTDPRRGQATWDDAVISQVRRFLVSPALTTP